MEAIRKLVPWKRIETNLLGAIVPRGKEEQMLSKEAKDLVQGLKD